MCNLGNEKLEAEELKYFWEEVDSNDGAHESSMARLALARRLTLRHLLPPLFEMPGEVSRCARWRVWVRHH